MKDGNKPNVYQLINKQHTLYTYNEMIFSLENVENCDTCYHMMNFENMMQSEINQTQKDEATKIDKFIETESRIESTGGCWEAGMGFIAYGYRVSVWNYEIPEDG